MNVKKAIETIEAAEKAGLRIPDVAEARRAADTLKRPATPPEGCVYRHSREEIEAVLVQTAERIQARMKGKADDQRSKNVSEGGERPSAGVPAKGGSVEPVRAGGGKASGGRGGEGGGG